MLCLGSSLRVTPAANMPQNTALLGGQLVIVNLQKTPLDSYASLIIHAKIDEMFDVLMDKLSLKIPQFMLSRWIKAKLSGTGAVKSPSSNLVVSGIDANGSPY